MFIAVSHYFVLLELGLIFGQVLAAVGVWWTLLKDLSTQLSLINSAT